MLSKRFLLVGLLAALVLPVVAVATSGYLPVLKSAAEGRGYGQGITVATFSGDATLDTDGVITVDGASGAFTQAGGIASLNASSNYAVNIATGTSTGTVTIGGTGTQSIAIGNGAGVKTVALGSSNTTSTTTILGGTGGLVLGDSTNGARGYVETSAPNGDTTLAASACGTVQFIGAAGDDFTLPAPAAGCRIRFVTDAAFATTAMTIVTESSANVIYGAVDVNSTLVPCSQEDTITIVESAELPGDYVEVLSDGTNWFVSGVAVTTGAVTCTQAS